MSEQFDRRMRTSIAALQLAEDALTYRQDRLRMPCPDCSPERWCLDHAYDARLVSHYQQICDSALSEALEGVDSSTIEQVKNRNELPRVVAAHSILEFARLQKLAVNGPVETVFDAQRVMIKLDEEGHIAVYPLPDDVESPAAV